MLTEKALYSLPSGSSIQTIEQAALVRLVVFITVIILSNVIFRYCGLDKVYIPAIVFGYILLITKIRNISV